MAVQELTGIGEAPRVAILNNPTVRGWIYQIVLLAVIVYLGWSAITNMFAALRAAHIASGFGFLGNTAGFSVSQALIPYDEGQSTYFTVYLVGLLNTILVSIVGVIFATLLGFVVGIARLSTNFIIRITAAAWIEVFRNIPPLLIIFIWYFGVLRLLPAPRDSIQIEGVMLLNNRGLFVPRPIPGDVFWVTVAALIVGIVATITMARWAKARQMRTGQPFPRLWTGLSLIIGLPILAFLVTGLPLSFDIPKVGTFRPSGGTTILPELISLFLALSTYTSAFIAEIVRAGILAVNKGQTEASFALGLRPGQALRLVVVPQALRVIIPPLTSEYLNLTKNSSLAVAIAYPDLVSVFAGTALNQTGQAVEILLMTMLTYLALSLLFSAGMNWYNAKMALVER